MGWPNPLVIYHGCDQTAAASIAAHGIQLSHCRPRTDFGRGFYATTSLHQAKNWANQRVRRIAHRTPTTATVLEFHVDRSALAGVGDCVFLLDDADYWALVAGCRTAAPAPGGPAHGFQLVWGPVSLWPQRLVVAACDQLSVHDPGIVPLLTLQGTIVPSHGPFF